jgi:hypothetical protein
VSRSLLAVIHNPRNRTCGCDPDCWCNRTAVGRAVKWWFNGRLVGLHHKSSFDGMTPDERREWKRKQSELHGGSPGVSPMVAQPKYEKVVGLGPRRWGLTVRLSDGRLGVHEILGGARFASSP